MGLGFLINKIILGLPHSSQQPGQWAGRMSRHAALAQLCGKSSLRLAEVSRENPWKAPGQMHSTSPAVSQALSPFRTASHFLEQFYEVGTVAISIQMRNPKSGSPSQYLWQGTWLQGGWIGSPSNQTGQWKLGGQVQIKGYNAPFSTARLL